MISRIGKNARLGDGLLQRGNPNGNAYAAFMSTDKDILYFKKTMCDMEGLKHSDFGTQLSGYGGTKTIWNFRVLTDKRLTEVLDIPLKDLLTSLDETDIYLWLIDDGSWHKKQNLFHLYCNMLDDTETTLLIERIGELFGIQPTMRKDRKKDGRAFNYLYFPRQLTIIFRPKLKQFLIENGLETMLYKVGGEEYSDILEALTDEAIINVNYHRLSNAIGGATRSGVVPEVTECERNVYVKWTQRNGVQERVISKEAV